jgi:phosphoadenosine phosphosulfate reductase
MEFTAETLNALSQEFESRTPQEIITWAVETFSPDLAVSSSFQTQSVPLLHMVSRIDPEILVFFLDTGYHFWETLMFREQLQRELGLRVQTLYVDGMWSNFLHRFGKELYKSDPDLCCYLRKVQPMQKAMKSVQAWISGIRRDQTENRAHASILELEPNGLIKINPLLNWKRQDVQAYIKEHNLPAHPLFEKGYKSIGCKPCTRAILAGEDERAGRWAGKDKTECGLHTDMFKKEGPPPGLMTNFMLFKTPISPQETKDE